MRTFRSQDALLTVPQAATQLAISRSKLYELFGSGRLKYVQIDRARRVSPDDLAEFIRNNTYDGPE